MICASKGEEARKRFSFYRKAQVEAMQSDAGQQQGGTVKREIKIIVETERTIELSNASVADENWCEACAAQTRMVSVEMAAAIASLGTGTIHHWITTGEFHYQRTVAGILRICQRSFIEHLKKINFLPKPKNTRPLR